MMKRSNGLLWLFLIMQLPISLAGAKEAAGLWPYVHSDLDDRFYARCIPAGDSGDKGATTIFMVKRTDDERVDAYDWYNRNGVVLGWSPIAGKVAVWRLRQDDSKPDPQRVEFSFYLGGKLLKSYTAQELIDRGSKFQDRLPRLDHAPLDYRVLGCQQVPGTNDYNFSIELRDGTPIHFDILTGEERKK